MNKTVPWSIKGVGSDTREAAKEAARRSGLSLGEWLDGIIAERAAKLGVPSVEIDDQARLDAIADELSRVASRSSALEDSAEAGSQAPAPRAPVDSTWAAVPQARLAGSPAAGAMARGISGLGTSFDSVVASLDQPSFGSRDPAPNVLQSVNGRASMDSRIRGAVHGSLAERLDLQEEDVQPAQRALRALSERLDSFERQNWAGPMRDGPANPRRSLGEQSTARVRKPGSAINSAKERSIREAVAEIARRQAALYEEDSNIAAAPAGDPVDLRSDPVRNGAGLGALNDAVSALEARLAGVRPAPKGSDQAGAVAAVERDRIGADQKLSSSIIGPAGQPSTEADVADPQRRGGQENVTPADAESMVAFATLGRDLRQAIESEGEPSAAAAQNEAPPALGGGKATADELTTDQRSDRPLASDKAAAPSARAVQAPQARATEASGELVEAQTTLGEIRALLDRFEPGSAVSSLERRMEDLAAKIDRGLAPQSSSKQIEDLARQIDELHSSIQGQAAFQPSAPGSVDALVAGIADRIQEAREASADIQRLESLIRSLAAKIDDGGAQAPPKALSALEAQMNRLGDRLERSEASLSALDGVEHSLGELFAQLEETRHATIDAAESAARTAARDTLRAAMQNPAVPHGMADGEAGFIGQVTHELAELRVTHDTTSRRTQATLMGLNQTMERLVEHLARLDVAARPSNGGPSQAADMMAATSTADSGEVRRGGAAPLVRAESGLQDRPDAVDPIDTLIEPGLGRAPVRERLVKSDAGTASADLEGPASFIAAARRAAQAAQASAAATQRPSGRVRISGEPKPVTTLSALERARNFLVERRRPLLLSLAGLVLLLGALEIAKLSMAGPVAPEQTGAAQTAEPAATVVASKPDADIAPKDAASKNETPAQAPSGAQAEAGRSPGTPPAAAASASNITPPLGTQKSAAAALNMNPFLPGNGFNLSGLGGGLRTAALAGDPAAQYEVGLRFAEGRTVNRDLKAAASWFEKAAEQGLAPAQYRLGSVFEKGIGQPKDPAMALTWYGRAAEAGNVRAMHNLAVMAAEGAVGKPDYARAAKWFEKAATLGVRDSQFNLAILYARGLGIEQSLGQSYTWFAIAASQGDDDAAKKRDEVGARLEAKALAAAKAAAENFRPGTAVSAANEVAPPPGGWDDAAPSRGLPSAAKSLPPRFTVM